MTRPTAEHAAPDWAPRVEKHLIRGLDENDAKGIYDEELIDEVGYALRSRCQSFIEANEARAGWARCASCSRTVRHKGHKEELLRCECGWELTWEAYFQSMQRKQLSGAEPVIHLFQEFVDRFPASRDERAKVFQIDRLLHGFHWHFKTPKPTRPAAINLIEGRLGDVMDFLDSLTYGEMSTPGTQENKAEWDINIQTTRGWYGKGDM